MKLWVAPVLLLLLVSPIIVPFFYHFIRRANDVAMGRLLQLGYTVGNVGWMILFLSYTGTRDPVLSQVVRAVLSEFPGGYHVHSRFPCVFGALGLVSWVVVKHTNPGIVHRGNARAVCSIDASVGGARIGKSCERCRITEVPPRTHHCSVCRHCVYRFDHHCFWMGICVGANNVRWFTAFLALHVMLYAYGICFIMLGVNSVYRLACAEHVPGASPEAVMMGQRDRRVLHAWLFGHPIHPSLPDSRATPPPASFLYYGKVNMSQS